MKRKSILYYPEIEPDIAFLKRYLLFFDTISRIVPKNIEPQSDDFRDSLNILRPYIKDIEPKPYTSLNEKELDRLDKAFRYISKSRQTEAVRDEIKIIIDKNGASTISVLGFAFTHMDKMTGRIIEMLNEHRLISPATKALPDLEVDENWILVESNASTVLLSCLAHQIARSEGIDTITDEESSFIVNSLNSMGISVPERNPEGVLTSSLIKVCIPSTIDTMPIEEYMNLREEYSEIRSSFQTMIYEMSGFHRLGEISNQQDLKKRINEIVEEFATDMIQFKKRKSRTNFRKWIPLSIGSISTLVGAALPDYREVSFSTAVITIAMTLYQEVAALKIPKTNEEITMDLLADLRGTIPSGSIKALI